MLWVCVNYHSLGTLVPTDGEVNWETYVDIWNSSKILNKFQWEFST